ncbi:helix-turn-helix domain-containing protein [Acidipropionibacterium acidipropionici]|uniref:helix-turn-helix domain-containing protein n=1 Tax=Acidipropionibacterium acidipropionici TaxID=1748 RepID=UPI001586ECE6|nr:helix-turn-helix transcriptional regulator [Acidipropionibacterium acidipropionici]
MHELGRFIQDLMDGHGWRQADLARASGITPATVSRLLVKDHLGRMVADETIAGLHRAFPEIPEGVFITKAAEALGVPVDRLETVDPDLSSLSDEALLGILAERLRERRSSDGRQPDAQKSDDRGAGAPDPGNNISRPGLTWQERRRQRMIEQAMNVEEAADLHPRQADFEVADEDMSQDPDDWLDDQHYDQDEGPWDD